MLQYLKDKLLALERRVNNLHGRVNNVSSNLSTYKVYTALLSQSGTDAPVATVLQNTIGNIVWSYWGVGLYYGTLSNAFPIDKTVIFITSTSNLLTEAANNENGEPSDQIFIRTFGNDSSLYLTSIEIRVYP